LFKVLGAAVTASPMPNAASVNEACFNQILRE